MAIENTNLPKPTSRKRKKKPVSDPGLLGELVNSRFFQVLIGRAGLIGPAPNTKTRANRQSRRKQSIFGMIIDVIIFGFLVLLAPLYTITKFIFDTLCRYWWVKFALGLATGCLTWYAVYRIVSIFL